MQKGSGTRSGLLWEVERLLTETKELPQVLLMENVPQVISEDNMPDFAKWLQFLESLGYTNKYHCINAKYYLPQNRNRCFMVSFLGEGYYLFPENPKMELRLKDMLEDNIDEKYYLSAALIEYFNKNTEVQKKKEMGSGLSPHTGGGVREA